MKILIFPTVAISFLLASPGPEAFASEKKGMNPDIAVNFLGTFRRDVQGSNSPTAIPRNGLNFQEAELQFKSEVDPFFRADALISIHPNATGEFAIEPEEVYLESTSLPVVTLKLGKFKAAFGKHNLLHTHAYPFVDAPLISQSVFGAEGFKDLGLSAATLFPTPWFFELTLQGLIAQNSSLYGAPTSDAYAWVGRLKNLWDLSESLTLEFGLSGTSGPNANAATANAWGADMTFKWRPVDGGKTQSFSWTTEYLNAFRPGNTAGDRLSGVATWLMYQFAQQWWVEARVERSGFASAPAVVPQDKQSGLLGFFPSEFSGFRLQYDHVAQSGTPDNHIATLQWNISIGAHPAHAY